MYLVFIYYAYVYKVLHFILNQSINQFILNGSGTNASCPTASKQHAIHSCDCISNVGPIQTFHTDITRPKFMFVSLNVVYCLYVCIDLRLMYAWPDWRVHACSTVTCSREC